MLHIIHQRRCNRDLCSFPWTDPDKQHVLSSQPSKLVKHGTNSRIHTLLSSSQYRPDHFRGPVNDENTGYSLPIPDPFNLVVTLSRVITPLVPNPNCRRADAVSTFTPPL